jgi:N-acetylglucosaminyldiphosphoundecaprenol N-acetyl-beta-D-mannosaminyltransferase
MYPLVPSIEIIGSPVTALTFDDQVNVILDWAQSQTSKFVCVANTHMLIEAYRSSEFMTVLRNADIVTPDGMPLVWMMKLLGLQNQNRVAGMDIFLATCQAASHQNLSVFCVGSQAEILDKMETRLEQEFPELCVVGMDPLPFRPMTLKEDEDLIERINASGASIVFVSLGCPKQEIWMAKHVGKIHAVMIGIGGVFPVYAGIQKRAPQWVRDVGLEWLYRLLQEPKRLWNRYRNTIPPFLYLAGRQLFRHEKLVLTRSRLSD